MRLKIETLTPIWTGGTKRLCDRLHETAVIGSIRWWHEAVARGFGLKVCDIINNPCPENKKWCHVCEVFGATGKSRMFRVAFLGDGLTTYEQSQPKNAINIRPAGCTTGWYQGAGRFSSEQNPITLEIVTIRGRTNRWASAVIPTLVLMERWGAIGSRTQHGFGVVKINDEHDNKINAADGGNHLMDISNDRSFPNIKDFFFSKIKVIPEPNVDKWIEKIDGLKNFRSFNVIAKRIQNMPKSLPSTPAVKNWLRYQLWPDLKQKETDLKSVHDGCLFGQARGDQKRASKIAISDIYLCDDRWEFRIWGWIPSVSKELSSKARTVFLTGLKDALSTNHPGLATALGQAKVELREWREYDSVNDTTSKESDFQKYFLSLIQ